ncbi:MAG: DoxX family protein [Nakamurella sp.]
MAIVRTLARPMLASMFVIGGLDSLRHPDTKAPAAEKVVRGLTEKLPGISDTAHVVRANGAVQVGAGGLLALGKLPRLSALALAGSLVPTTLAGHSFWAETDPQKRSMQRIQFFKNLSMLGGLLLAAVDTAGKPSLGWRAKHAVVAVKEKVSGDD